MKRVAVEKERMTRIWRQHLRINHGWPAKEVLCACEFEVGRFRKRMRVFQGCSCHRCRAMSRTEKHGDSIRDARLDAQAAVV